MSRKVEIDKISKIVNKMKMILKDSDLDYGQIIAILEVVKFDYLMDSRDLRP